MARSLFFAAALAAVPLAAWAQSAAELDAQGTQAYQAKDYARAAALYEQAFARDPALATELYNAACAWALAGNKDQALGALRRAFEAGFVDGAAAEKDSDFTTLHADPRWPVLIAAMKQAGLREARLYASPALATPWQPNISEDEKVAGLSKFWSEVKYNFVFVDKLKELDWDKLYLETLPKVRATTSTAEYYKVLMALCARLQDGHTNVYPSWQVWNQDLARTKIRTRLVEGRVLVLDVYDPALRAQGVVPGVEVLAVDGEAALAYGKRVHAPYQSASTPQDLDVRTYGYAFLTGPLKEAPRVSFADAGGRKFEVAIARYLNADLDPVVTPRAPFVLNMLPGNVAHVTLNSFGDSKAADAFIAAFPEIAKSSALILDVRNNGGGNSDQGYRVLATITDKPFMTGQWSTRKYVPTYRAWKRPMPDLAEAAGSWPADLAHAYRKPVRVLTSAATYSAAEDFAAAFSAMGRGPIVGEATGGSTGQPLQIALPGGGTARICTKRDTYPDGRPWVGIGIAPGLAVSPRIDDFRKGRDTVLEAALASLPK